MVIKGHGLRETEHLCLGRTDVFVFSQSGQIPPSLSYSGGHMVGRMDKWRDEELGAPWSSSSVLITCNTSQIL